MRLSSQDEITALDADFGGMAVAIGRHAWSLPDLTMREKAFCFIAADLCSRGVGFPLQTHCDMAMNNGVHRADLREAVRHLAPYVGCTSAAEGRICPFGSGRCAR